MIDAAGTRKVRNRALAAQLTLYFTLALGLYFGQGYTRVLRELLAGVRAERTAIGDGSATPHARPEPEGITDAVATRLAGPPYALARDAGPATGAEPFGGVPGPGADRGADVVIEAVGTGGPDAAPTAGNGGWAFAADATECTRAPREATVTLIGPV